MVEITGQYLEPHKCSLIHGPSGTIIETDAPRDNGGSGALFSPTDLLAASYGSCMLTIMSLHCQKIEKSLQGSKFKVEKHMTSESPRRIARIVVAFELPDHFTEEEKSTLVEKARNCPVALSVATDVKVECAFQFNGT